jgi:hypothetical protein
MKKKCGRKRGTRKRERERERVERGVGDWK